MAQEQYMLTTKKSLIQWYREQLQRFLKLGMGNWTEHNVQITEGLINTTKKRIVQLGGEAALRPGWGQIEAESSDNPSTNRVRQFREREKVKLRLREKINGNHTNGTASHARSESNGNNGHEGDQS